MIINIFINASLYIPAPFWILTIFQPHLSITKWLVRSYITLIPLGIMYAKTLLPNMHVLQPLWTLNFSEELLQRAFAQPALSSAVWFHTVFHDVFAATWIYIGSYSHERVYRTWVTSLLIAVSMNIGAPLAVILQLLRIVSAFGLPKF